MSQKLERDFGKRSGLQCNRVSIGAMRLPQDDDAAVALMREAIDAGLVYIDTSRGYGDSEIKVGKSLKDGYREKVILSTKWAPWVVKIEEGDDASADCTYKRIVESMERLDVDYLDFYQLWSIGKREHYDAATAPGGMLDGIRRAVDEGLVGHIGFTTHDTPENISTYIDEAGWCEAILFTYNILNPTYKEVLAKAHEKGIATIVMNPVGGGMLAEGSSTLQEAFGTTELVDTAYRYLAADDNVDTVITGITKSSDIWSTLDAYSKPPLGVDECRKIEEQAGKLSKESMGFCTNCGYCMPCPSGLNIPGIMHAVYMDRLLGAPQAAEHHYRLFAKKEKKTQASNCTQCGVCEEKCTQKLPIIEQMEYMAGRFDKGE